MALDIEDRKLKDNKMIDITKNYSYEDIKKYLNDIVRQMTLVSFIPEFIVGVARGGLIPAVHLSHYFEVPLITLNLSLRDQKIQNDVSFETAFDAVRLGRNVLIVDDICDQGHTLIHIDQALKMNISDEIDLLKTLRTAVLIYNDAENVFTPDFCGHIIDKNERPEWCVFPWEEWYKS